MPPRKNQFKPLPPIDDLAPHIYRFWKMRKNDVEILACLLDPQETDIDWETYGLGIKSFKKIRKSLGLLSTRQQGHTLDSIHEHISQLRQDFPKAGAREMVSLLFHKKSLNVSKDLVVAYFRIFEPELVRMRKAGRLQRRRFWAAGVNDMFAVDQHDKWKRFGLALHTGIDPFPGVIHWIRVWWTNNNPKLILSYYLDTITRTGYMPLITQSDPGSENYGIANGHTLLRHLHDPSLVGTVQHRWMRHKKNVMPEIGWSQMRRRFTPGFENLLEKGVINGWYDMNQPLDILVFRWLFIPFIQLELDAWTDRINNTRKRKDRNKVLPHGVPNDILHSPQRYGCLDFKIAVDQSAIDHVRNVYAPPGDPVFELAPPEFSRYADILFQTMGTPSINSTTIWDVYRELLARFERLDDAVNFADQCQVYLSLLEATDQDEIEAPHGLELLGGMENPATDGGYYMGGVNNGGGLDRTLETELDEMENDNSDFEVNEVVFSDIENGENDDLDEW